MTYTRQRWADNSAGGTPITAGRLNYMEDGIAAADAQRIARTSGAARIVASAPAYAPGHNWWSADTNYDATNSSMNDTTQFDIGSQSIRMVTLGNGGSASVGKDLPTAIDASNCVVRVRFRLTNTNLNSMQIAVGNADFSQNSFAFMFTLSGTTSTLLWPWQTGRWATVDVPRHAFSGNVNWANISKLLIQVTDKNATTTVHVAGVDFVQDNPRSAQSMAVWTLDDSYAGQEATVRPALNARGWKATVFPIIDALGASQRLTLAQIRAMHDTYGWEIGAHAYSNAAHGLGMTAMSQAQRLSEIEAMLGWMDGYGFDSPSYAWPLGSHDAASEADVGRYFTSARLAFAPLLEPLTLPRRYSIQAINVGTQTANLHSYIDKAVASPTLLIFVVHDVVTSGGTSNDITVANFNDTVSYLAASGIPVKTMSEAMTALL